MDCDNGPQAKMSRNNSGPNLIRADIDPNSSDHMVAMTQLKEQIAMLKKQIAQKDALILSKDKMVSVRIKIVYLSIFCYFF